MHLTQLAEAYRPVGRADTGLATPDEALGLVARAGDHIWDAEWHRLKGELLLIQGAEESAAEACFRTVIAVAVGMVLQHLLDVGGVGREVGPPDPHWQRDHRPIAARRRGQVPERVAAQPREDAQGRKGPGMAVCRRECLICPLMRHVNRDCWLYESPHHHGPVARVARARAPRQTTDGGHRPDWGSTRTGAASVLFICGAHSAYRGRARRLTTILPAMSIAEALETTRIHSVAGETSGPSTLTVANLGRVSP